MCHTIFLEPRGLPGEHDAWWIGPGFPAVSKGHGVKPMALQKLTEFGEICIHRETGPTQRFGSQPHQRLDVEGLEDRKDADSVTIGANGGLSLNRPFCGT